MIALVFRQVGDMFGVAGLRVRLRVGVRAAVPVESRARARRPLRSHQAQLLHHPGSGVPLACDPKIR